MCGCLSVYVSIFVCLNMCISPCMYECVHLYCVRNQEFEDKKQIDILNCEVEVQVETHLTRNRHIVCSSSSPVIVGSTVHM